MKKLFGTVCLGALLAGCFLAEKLENKFAFYDAIALLPGAIAGARWDEKPPTLIGTERMTINTVAGTSYSASITVPSDCTLVVIGYSARYTTTNTLGVVSLNGFSMSDSGSACSPRSQLSNSLTSFLGSWLTSRVGTGTMTFQCTNSVNFSSACGYVWYFKDCGGVISNGTARETYNSMPSQWINWRASDSTLRCSIRPSSRFSKFCAVGSIVSATSSWTGTNLNIDDTQAHASTTTHTFASSPENKDWNNQGSVDFTLVNGGAGLAYMGMLEVLGLPNNAPTVESISRYEFSSIGSGTSTAAKDLFFTAAEVGSTPPPGKDRILLISIFSTNSTTLLNVTVNNVVIPSGQMIYGRGNANTDWNAGNMVVAYTVFNDDVLTTPVSIHWTVKTIMHVCTNSIRGPLSNTPLYTYNVAIASGTTANTQGFSTVKDGVTLMHYYTTAIVNSPNIALTNANTANLAPSMTTYTAIGEIINNQSGNYVFCNNMLGDQTIYLKANSDATISKGLIVTTWR